MTTLPPLILVPLARTYHVNMQKPFFPVNTMRLFYLMLVRDLTENDETALDTMNSAVPKISAVGTESEKLSGTLTDPEAVHKRLEGVREDLYQVVDTPQLRFDVEVTLQQELLPYQETLTKLLREPDPHAPRLHFSRLLHLRSLDHFLYAQTVGSVLQLDRERQAKTARAETFHPRLNSPSVLRQCIRAMLQINDISDAVVHAKEDLESGFSVLLKAARACVSTPEETEGFLRSEIHALQQALAGLPLSAPADQNVQTYASHLANVLDGEAYDGL